MKWQNLILRVIFIVLKKVQDGMFMTFFSYLSSILSLIVILHWQYSYVREKAALTILAYVSLQILAHSF